MTNIRAFSIAYGKYVKIRIELHVHKYLNTQ